MSLYPLNHETGSEPIMSVRNLYVDYVLRDGRTVPSCQDINLDIYPGEIVGVAGESGSGKSTLLNALGRLQRPPAVTSGGQILFRSRNRDADSVDLAALNEKQLEKYRWDEISIVMQSAMASLNPVMRVKDQFIDVLQKHNSELSKDEALTEARRLMELVGIDPARLNGYPHEFSGGMQQRALIALSMACRPSLILMDEPTTAVDVILQRRILNQILELQREYGFAIVFVTHDLSLLMEISDRIAIMYAGKIVEVGTPKTLYERAQHPYTRGLRDAFPALSEPVHALKSIEGTTPDLANLPPGCAFAPRCPLAQEICVRITPELELKNRELVACHFAEESAAMNFEEREAAS